MTPTILDKDGERLSVGDRVRYPWAATRMKSGEIAQVNQGRYGPEVVVHFPSGRGFFVHRSFSSATSEANTYRCNDLQLAAQPREEGSA